MVYFFFFDREFTTEVKEPVNTMMMKRDQGSLSSSVGKLVSDDEMSLHDNASINAGKFNEDGSFVGQ